MYTLYANEDIYNVAKTIKYFSKNEEIATFTFNEKGVATVKVTNTSTKASLSVSGNTLTGLPMGSYYAKETTVPTGYTQDTNTYTYTFSYKDSTSSAIKQSGTVENTVQKAPFTVIKVTTNDNTIAPYVEGAEFTAILTRYVDYYGSFEEALKHIDEFAEDEYSIFTTSEEGVGVSGLLAYGDYTVNETYTPSSKIETVEEFYVTIDKNSETSIKTLVANDAPFESYLKLEKKDATSGKYVTYSNATFELYKLNEEIGEYEQVSCKVGKDYYTSWTTDSEGVARTENKLESGTYKLSEIVIPEGFLALDEDLIFTIDRKNSTLEYDDDLDAWITVTVENEQPVGMLSITKNVEQVEEDSNYTYFTGKGNIDYSQIKYTIVAAENIIDYADGSYVYTEGEIIGEYSVNEDGTLNIKLPMGKYNFYESSTIFGYVLDENIYEVEFTKEDNTTKVYTVEFEFNNFMTTVEISKVNVNNELIEGCNLELYEVRYREGGVEDSYLFLMDTWSTTDENHIIKGLSVDGIYILVEVSATENYVIAKSIEFTVENTNDVQLVTMVDKQVAIAKVDIAGEEVEGATLIVYDKDGNVIDEWVSTDTPHYMSDLEEGETYILHEEIAPDEYVFAQDIEFTVSYDKETQIVELVDKQVEIAKVDIAGEEIEGATLQIIDKDGNIVEEWVSTTTPHKVTGLVEGETYILHEEIEPDGYLLAQDIEFTVSYDKETQTITMVDEIPEVTIYKYAKTDSELFGYKAGDPLAGCSITIYDSEGNIVDVVTTGADGSVTVNLLRGVYTFVETDPPEGFLNDSTPITLNIDGDTTSLEVVFENSAVEVELEIDKTGIIQAQPKDEIRYDFPTLINKSNVSLDNFTWWDELPYEYITLTKLFTGTYNEDLDYEVYYMLVGSNEWTYYGTYNTQVNNCIDFTQIDGVVANFKICFGTVMSGFSCVETPFIYTLVNDTVTAEDEWTNYTYLTGDYITKSGEVINLEDKAEWTVISYGYKLEVNKLPRTGDTDKLAVLSMEVIFIGLSLISFFITRKLRKI